MIESHNADSWFFDYWDTGEEQYVGRLCESCAERPPEAGSDKCTSCSGIEIGEVNVPDGYDSLEEWVEDGAPEQSQNQFGQTLRRRTVKRSGFMAGKKKEIWVWE